MAADRAFMFVGGGPLQVPGIRAARDKGFLTVVTDVRDDAPGLALADHGVVCDGTDPSAVTAAAREASQKARLAGIYAGNDFALTAIAAARAAVGLPGPSVDAVEIALDKVRAREAFVSAGVPCPKGAAVASLDEASEAAASTGYPVIVKPAGASGSMGVRSVTAPADLEPAYQEARALSPDVLIEELVQGRHIDVNALMIEGSVNLLGTFERFFSEPPLHFPVTAEQPADLEDADLSAIAGLLRHAAVALGIADGPMKADLIWSRSGPVVLEISPRFHGEVGSGYLSPVAYGCSPVESMLDHVLSPDGWRIPSWTGLVAGWAGIFPDRGGRVASIEGVEETLRMPGVLDAGMRVAPGSAVREPRDNRDVCGFVWARAQDRTALRETLALVRRSVRVVLTR